jgi:hypothetical protein
MTQKSEYHPLTDLIEDSFCLDEVYKKEADKIIRKWLKPKVEEIQSIGKSVTGDEWEWRVIPKILGIVELTLEDKYEEYLEKCKYRNQAKPTKLAQIARKHYEGYVS